MSDPTHMPLATMAVKVSHAFAYTEEWDRLENDPVARDVFLAIGQSHLRGPEFFEDCFKFSAFVRKGCPHCGKPPLLETSKDLLDALRGSCTDGALCDPWAVVIRSGWPSNDSSTERIRRDEFAREIRLRELLEMVKCGIEEMSDEGDRMHPALGRHIKFTIEPAPPEPEPILHYEI